ncbi:peptidase inhibitor family I36 protein [Streptomyces sp. NPDC085946]|uniref:peptidase inhibitor family I36 protein n=1 Tax=Streptomyces sp. NPDC085946 TaxID=3365744 RepID=UPI0037D00A04
MNRSRLSAIGMVFAATVAFGAVSTPSASAHYSQCPANELCMWEHTGYEGRFAYTSEPNRNIGADMNDRISSYWNRTDQWFSFYTGENWGGKYCVNVGPGSSRAALYDPMTDSITSLRPGKCTTSTTPHLLWEAL